MNVRESAVLVSLRISMWSARKAEKSVEALVDQTYNAMNAGSYNKRLLPAEALSKVASVANEARTFHLNNTLPWSDMSRLLPTAKWLEYVSAMDDYKQRFNDALDDLITEYDIEKQKARNILGDLYNDSDYPVGIKLKDKFALNYSILPVESVEGFHAKCLNAYMEEIKARIEDDVKHKTKEALKSLWVRLYQKISAFHERINDPKNIFRSSLVENIKATIDVCRDLNIMQDEDLENALDILRQEFYSVSIDLLRQDDDYRRDKAIAAKNLLTNIQVYIEEE